MADFYHIEDRDGLLFRHYGRGYYGWLERSSLNGTLGEVVLFDSLDQADKCMAVGGVFFRAAGAVVKQHLESGVWG